MFLIILCIALLLTNIFQSSVLKAEFSRYQRIRLAVHYSTASFPAVREQPFSKPIDSCSFGETVLKIHVYALLMYAQKLRTSKLRTYSKKKDVYAQTLYAQKMRTR